MITKTVDIKNPRINLEDILALVRQGADVILTEASKPFARMMPYTKSLSERVAGLHEGAIQTSDDFDEPLPDEFWTGGK